MSPDSNVPSKAPVVLSIKGSAAVLATKRREGSELESGSKDQPPTTGLVDGKGNVSVAGRERVWAEEEERARRRLFQKSLLEKDRSGGGSERRRSDASRRHDSGHRHRRSSGGSRSHRREASGADADEGAEPGPRAEIERRGSLDSSHADASRHRSSEGSKRRSSEGSHRHRSSEGSKHRSSEGSHRHRSSKSGHSSRHSRRHSDDRAGTMDDSKSSVAGSHEAEAESIAGGDQDAAVGDGPQDSAMLAEDVQDTAVVSDGSHEPEDVAMMVEQDSAMTAENGQDKPIASTPASESPGLVQPIVGVEMTDTSAGYSRTMDSMSDVEMGESGAVSRSKDYLHSGKWAVVGKDGVIVQPGTGEEVDVQVQKMARESAPTISTPTPATVPEQLDPPLNPEQSDWKRSEAPVTAQIDRPAITKPTPQLREADKNDSRDLAKYLLQRQRGVRHKKRTRSRETVAASVSKRARRAPKSVAREPPSESACIYDVRKIVRESQGAAPRPTPIDRLRGMGLSALGDYRSERKIGEGTFGKVYIARKNVRPDAMPRVVGVGRVAPGDTVALKSFQVHGKTGITSAAARELSTMSVLNHPNILPLLDVLFVPDESGASLSNGFYVALPFMAHDLAGLINNHAVNLTPPTVKLYARQFLEGIAYMHACGIIHRDIKPANILIDESGVLKLADFGLAKAIGSERLRAVEIQTPGVVTPWYRAPEVIISDKHYHYPVDMWSAGCTILEMFYQQPVFLGMGDLKQLELIVELCGNPDLTRPLGVAILKTSFRPSYIRRHTPPPERKVNEFALKFSNDPIFADFIDHILRWDPEDRLTAKDALRHEYFFTEPRAFEIGKVPSFPSSHDADFTRENYEYEHLQSKHHTLVAMLDEQLRMKNRVAAGGPGGVGGPGYRPGPFNGGNRYMNNRGPGQNASMRGFNRGFNSNSGNAGMSNGGYRTGPTGPHGGQHAGLSINDLVKPSMGPGAGPHRGMGRAPGMNIGQLSSTAGRPRSMTSQHRNVNRQR